MHDPKLHLQTAAADRILLAAHRGVSGGNIPCNTLEAYEIALRQGADIVEIDIAVTADRSLYVFPPGLEQLPWTKQCIHSTKQATMVCITDISNDFWIF